jgi:hypothetical protein
VVAIAAVTIAGCKKKEEPESVPPPPNQGGASVEVVATTIGSGLGIPSELAPTSTIWDRVFVINDKTAIVAGRALDEAVALRTTDGGRSWVSLRTKAHTWVSWSAGEDGSVVLADGNRKKVKAAAGALAPIESARLRFAPLEGQLSEPATLFPAEDKLKSAAVPGGFATPAVLSPELASLLVTEGRQPVFAYGAPGGQQQPPALKAPRGRFVTTPYGRPPQLLSVAGAAIEVRPWPRPGEPLGPGSRIPGAVAGAKAFEQLNRGPACETGHWSIQRLAAGPTRASIVGVSADRSFAFPVPGGAIEQIGCGPEGVVVETVDPEKKQPQLTRCALDGKCATPKSLPFEIWPDKHERTILSAATKQGVVATMCAKTGARWGAYLAQSLDGGATFELPRIIGEGKSERGYFQVGALINLPGRVLILMSADVTGTTRRGWYVLASDDGGSNWGPP